jgi:hypothetical protein
MPGYCTISECGPNAFRACHFWTLGLFLGQQEMFSETLGPALFILEYLVIDTGYDSMSCENLLSSRGSLNKCKMLRRLAEEPAPKA